MKKTVASPRKPNRKKKYYATWINGDFVCSCRSKKFTVSRERVARKVHSKKSHRLRTVGICARGHKSRIGFGS